MLIHTKSQEIISSYTVERRNRSELVRSNRHFGVNRFIKLYAPWYHFPNPVKNIISNEEVESLKGMWYREKEWDKIEIDFRQTLYDYQQSAIDHIIENKWWLIELKTGWGKSYICMWLTAYYKSPTLIVVPSKKLVKEMRDKYKELCFEEIWCYYSDKKIEHPITVTTHQSFVENYKYFRNKYKVLIIDECDTKVTDRFIEALCNVWAEIVVWMSWTPNRQDLHLQDLEKLYGKHIKVWWYQILPSSITHYEYVWWEVIPDKNGKMDWIKTRQGIMNNKDRAEYIIQKLKKIREENSVVLVLIDRIKEVDLYLDAMWDDSIKITWKTKIKDDEENIKSVLEKWWYIIWSIDKMYRWVDIPQIDSVVILSPIKFHSKVIQSIGRWLRKYWEKETNVYIFNDKILRNQLYQQKKACKQEYWFEWKIVLLNQ